MLVYPELVYPEEIYPELVEGSKGGNPPHSGA
jgi:hypothetical protein